MLLNDKLFKERRGALTTMMFCPKCGSIMFPKEEKGKKFLACKCGYTNKKAKGEMKETMAATEELRVVDSEETANPIIDTDCPECGPAKAEFWTVQTRASDEPETQFFKCKNCDKTWKE